MKRDFSETFAKISVNLGESISTLIGLSLTPLHFLCFQYIFGQSEITLLLLFIKKYQSNNIPLLIIMLKYNEWTIDSKADMNNKCEILRPEEG